MDQRSSVLYTVYLLLLVAVFVAMILTATRMQQQRAELRARLESGDEERFMLQQQHPVGYGVEIPRLTMNKLCIGDACLGSADRFHGDSWMELFTDGRLTDTVLEEHLSLPSHSVYASPHKRGDSARELIKHHAPGNSYINRVPTRTPLDPGLKEDGTLAADALIVWRFYTKNRNGEGNNQKSQNLPQGLYSLIPRSYYLRGQGGRPTYFRFAYSNPANPLSHGNGLVVLDDEDRVVFGYGNTSPQREAVDGSSPNSTYNRFRRRSAYRDLDAYNSWVVHEMWIDWNTRTYDVTVYLEGDPDKKFREQGRPLGPGQNMYRFCTVSRIQTSSGAAKSGTGKMISYVRERTYRDHLLTFALYKAFVCHSLVGFVDLFGVSSDNDSLGRLWQVHAKRYIKVVKDHTVNSEHGVMIDKGDREDVANPMAEYTPEGWEMGVRPRKFTVDMNDTESSNSHGGYIYLIDSQGNQCLVYGSGNPQLEITAKDGKIRRLADWAYDTWSHLEVEFNWERGTMAWKITGDPQTLEQRDVPINGVNVRTVAIGNGTRLAGRTNVESHSNTKSKVVFCNARMYF